MAALDLSSPALELSFLPTPLSVIQLKPSQAIPSKLLQALTGAGDAHSFVSITRCPDEISIILPASQFEELYPPTSLGPWTTLKVAGPMDLSLTGILNELTGPLKTAQVPIFASSTWNTDYVLIEERHKEAARAALEQAGWKFAP
ncbi:ACT domain-containing protein [Rhodotorula diobovata]|uniref:ACT domain-containing protein n=1 Tax=Rhodotorula diobovata TaxID=5288 RepID=A0A5C5FR49_9BASI|nr:ACT domain-containing protein [Rhodotorula diobovata]